MDMDPWGARMSYSTTPMLKPFKRSKSDKVTQQIAQQLIEDDWIFQAEDTITPKRTLLEIQWTRELTERFVSAFPDLNFSPELASLSALEVRLNKLPPLLDDSNSRELYFDVRKIKRGIMLRNPLLDFNRILLVDTPRYASRHESAHRNG